MFFDIDDAYASGVNDLAIDVTYADIGTDSFYATCLDENGMLIRDGIAKTNTRNWLTQQFVLVDCDLSGGMASGSDFAIYDNGDGQEIIQMVKASVPSGPGVPTATTTWTPTNPAAPTPTPIPTIPATATPAAVLVLDPSNNVWKDTHLLSQSPNTNTGSWNTVGLRAGTVVTVSTSD